MPVEYGPPGAVQQPKQGARAVKKRYILIGGTGFFGAALARELRARGLTVVTVARGSRSTRRQPNVRLDVVRAPELLGSILEPGDTVVYLAGLSPLKRPVGGRRRYREVHLTGFRAALAAAESRGVSRFVQVSALGVQSGCGAAYGETKTRATELLREAAAQVMPNGPARIEPMVVEPSVLFGDGSEIIRTLKRVSRLPLVPLPQIAAQIRPIHVTDAARRLADALTAAQMPGRLELTGPELLAFHQLAAAYLEPRETRVMLLPRSLTRLLVWLASRLKLPGAPAELKAMLALDNAGSPPSQPEELIMFSRWASESRPRGR
ncbi:MAG: NAD-dependent epimerase/dehydratase family protein [Spirochaetaceae bacterium]|nr:MAG: NAD-dependent epimerase/dehydratase family protein [Spirochaetaceae bacterium]